MTLISLRNVIIDGIDFETVSVLAVVTPVQNGKPFPAPSGELVFPEPDRFTISDGAFSLMETDGLWCWCITLSYMGHSLTRHVFVEGEQVSFHDLVDVDPSTLIPDTNPVNGWRALRDRTVIDGKVVGDDLHLITYGGDELDAGDVRGPRGATGPRGERGQQGPQGVQGPRGFTGPQGAQGATGERGPVGPQGSEGPQGVQGVPGPKGADSTVPGPAGPKGDTGAQGVKGDTGAQGAQGPKGDKGDTGAQGVKGDTGAQGVQGPKGDKGDTGAQGVQGIPGSPTAADVAWTDISADLDVAFRGSLWARVRYGQVEIILNALTGSSVPVGNTVLGNIRAAFRPDSRGNRRGQAYFDSSYTGVLYLTPSGEFGVSHQSGAARLRPQGTIQFPQG